MGEFMDLVQEPTPANIKQMTTEIQQVLDQPRLCPGLSPSVLDRPGKGDRHRVPGMLAETVTIAGHNGDPIERPRAPSGRSTSPRGGAAPHAGVGRVE